jgi:hypothetical protein
MRLSDGCLRVYDPKAGLDSGRNAAGIGLHPAGAAGPEPEGCRGNFRNEVISVEVRPLPCSEGLQDPVCFPSLAGAFPPVLLIRRGEADTVPISASPSSRKRSVTG